MFNGVHTSSFIGPFSSNRYVSWSRRVVGKQRRLFRKPWSTWMNRSLWEHRPKLGWCRQWCEISHLPHLEGSKFLEKHVSHSWWVIAISVMMHLLFMIRGKTSQVPLATGSFYSIKNPSGWTKQCIKCTRVGSRHFLKHILTSVKIPWTSCTIFW